MNKNMGFTLIETLVYIAIAISLAFVAIPNFTSMIHNNAAKAVSQSLFQTFNYARNQAISQGKPVSICPLASNLSTCDNQAVFTNGWIVFIDENENGAINGSSNILKIYQSVSDIAIVNATSPYYITFEANGFVSTDTRNMIYTIKPSECSADNGREISISLLGVPTVTKLTCN